MLAELAIYPGIFFILFLGLLYCGVFRKISARMQNRIGPPVWQAFYDVAKLLGKENLSPSGATPGFSVWPAIALASALVAALLMPIAGGAPLSAAGDIIVIMYFLILSSAALYMAGFSSSNAYASVGASRGFMQIVAYEAPFILAVLFPVFFYKSVSLTYFNNVQGAGAFALEFPLAALVFLLAVLGKLELPPFHIPGAHQEIVGGYYVELSGFRLAMVELTHAVKTIALLAFGVALFFGGADNIYAFVAKTFGLLFALAISRAALARLRIEQAFRLYWGLAAVLVLNFAANYLGLL